MPVAGANRRAFIAALGGGAAAWPLATLAQHPERMRLIGVLVPYAENDPQSALGVTALRQALQQLGWMEGRNVRFELRWSPDAEATGKLVKQLVDLRPDAILTDTTPLTAAALHATSIIPIIFVPAIRSVGDSSLATHTLAVTPPGSTISRSRSRANGLNCSRRSHRARSGRCSCSTHRQLPMRTFF
jgi:putative ABC transport system substrate-binding protein